MTSQIPHHSMKGVRESEHTRDRIRVLCDGEHADEFLSQSQGLDLVQTLHSQIRIDNSEDKLFAPWEYNRLV